MPGDLVEVRLLPPFAVGRLGSSPEPMDNYDLVVRDPIGPRDIRAADTLLVDTATGAATLKRAPFPVRFRDEDGRIRPVAPFLEAWVRSAGEAALVPLTTALLDEKGLTPAQVRWRVHVANRKASRRTADPGDIVEADTGWFADHARRALDGRCTNFVDGRSVPFGYAQYVAPCPALPEIRLRFTPAAGKVYGPEGFYDSTKGKWLGYCQPTDLTAEPIGTRLGTNPEDVYNGENRGNDWVSAGQFDDECDGIVDVALETPAGVLAAYGRITAGPPMFAPDSMPVRTVGDELEQALLGPEFDGPITDRELAEVREIVRRALETVRLMNTAEMNQATTGANVGMARDDYLWWKRALEPIVDPALADALAIRARHERILLALESGSLAWFARVLRHYDEVGDLSTLGRRRMPALMRGADGNHLALTRRQVSKVRAAAEYVRRLAAGDTR